MSLDNSSSGDSLSTCHIPRHTALPAEVLLVSAVFLLAEILSGLMGAFLICRSVFLSKSLRTPVNALIVNLAAVGLLAAVTCSPLLLWSVAMEGAWFEASDVTREVYLLSVSTFTFFVLCTTVQAVTAVSVSYERYQAIASPFDKNKRLKRIKLSLGVSWGLGLLSAAAYIAICVTVRDKETHQHLVVQPSPPGSVFLKFCFAPLFLFFVVLVLVLYGGIITLIHRHVNRTETSLFRGKNKVHPAAGSASKASVIDLKPNKLPDGGSKAKNSGAENSKVSIEIPVIKVTPSRKAPYDGTKEPLDAPADKSILPDQIETEVTDVEQRIEPTTPLGVMETPNQEPPKADTPEEREARSADPVLSKDALNATSLNQEIATPAGTTLGVSGPSEEHESPVNEFGLKIATGEDAAASGSNTCMAATEYTGNASKTADANNISLTSKREINIKRTAASVRDGESIGVATQSGDKSVDTTPIKLLKAPKKGEKQPHKVEVCGMDGSVKVAVIDNPEVSGAICVMNSQNRERGRRRIEAKTAKTAAVVVGIFVVCSLPFPVVTLATAVASCNDVALKELVFRSLSLITMSLAILAMALNPIVYGVANRQLRNEFKKTMKTCAKKVCYKRKQ